MHNFVSMLFCLPGRTEFTEPGLWFRETQTWRKRERYAGRAVRLKRTGCANVGFTVVPDPAPLGLLKDKRTHAIHFLCVALFFPETVLSKLDAKLQCAVRVRVCVCVLGVGLVTLCVCVCWVCVLGVCVGCGAGHIVCE